MAMESLNLNKVAEKQDIQSERLKPRMEKREKGSIFSETFKAVTLAGILLLGAHEGFKTFKEMVVVSDSHLVSESKDGKRIVVGEVVTAAGKKYKYKVPTEMDENIPTRGSVGGGTIFEGNIEEITQDGSGVKIEVRKVLGRDQVEVRTEHFKKGGELEKTTFAYVSAEPQEVSVK